AAAGPIDRLFQRGHHDVIRKTPFDPGQRVLLIHDSFPCDREPVAPESVQYIPAARFNISPKRRQRPQSESTLGLAVRGRPTTASGVARNVPSPPAPLPRRGRGEKTCPHPLPLSRVAGEGSSRCRFVVHSRKSAAIPAPAVRGLSDGPKLTMAPTLQAA